MGILRITLAISVVFAHLSVEQLIGGQLAVQLFFLISGYLISFVLVEAKTYSNVSVFYLNRALRIFPLYWCVAIFALIFNYYLLRSTGENSFIDTMSSLPQGGSELFSLMNVIIVGQD